MAQAAPSAKLSGLAYALVQQGKLHNADAEALQAQAATDSSAFVTQLVHSKKLSAQEIAQFAAETFGYPLFDLNALRPDDVPKKALKPELMQKRRVVALLERNNKLYIGMSDPTNQQALEEVRFQSGKVVEAVIVEDDKLGHLITKVSESAETSLNKLVDEDIDLDFETGGESAADEDSGSTEVDDAPIVRYVQKVLIKAIEVGASDIHFEPYEKYYRVRFRQDGILYEFEKPPLAIKEKLAARIKVISEMDISERRIPQDGRMRLRLSRERFIDFRVSTLPTLFGEKIVMRILDPSSATLGIEALGYEPDQKEALLEAINRPYGMVLVTGPTGSGKTVSLYTCLNILNKPGINISTAEDPAEINLPGINQVNVNDKVGLTFAAALKSFLRQDPDIVMVGEIRDLETADIAIKAAQTGHMVLSTLHTNDAPKTLTRLMNMGVAPFNIASSVNLITAQRLGRRLCQHCKQPMEIPPEVLLKVGFSEADLDGSWTPYHPKEGGCDVCNGKGYKGRVGIYEVMPISEEMTRIIMSQGNAIDIADQARREGVRNLRQSGLLKVKQGLTSLEEVEAVTNE